MMTQETSRDIAYYSLLNYLTQIRGEIPDKDNEVKYEVWRDSSLLLLHKFFRGNKPKAELLEILETLYLMR